MVGYPEALTDPSYCGQILVLTFPLVGNYGVPSAKQLDALGLPANFESDRIQITGLVVSNYSVKHSHWASLRSLGGWLCDHDIPALCGVDTRAITKLIRESGTILGLVNVQGCAEEQFMDPNKRNLVAEVSCKTIRSFGVGQLPRIVVFDCGIKNNIIRYLVNVQKVEAIVVPYNYNLESNPSGLVYDGVFLSNGPGNPSMVRHGFDRWCTYSNIALSLLTLAQPWPAGT